MRKTFNRFCYKYEKFGISNLMYYIAGGYIITFIAEIAARANGNSIIPMLTFNLNAILQGQIWRLLTFLLIPPTMDVLFVVFAILFAVFAGRSLEAAWGKMRLTIYYFSGALLSILVATGFTLLTGFSLPIDNTFLNLSLIMAFGTVFPDQEVRLMLILPVPAKVFALIGGASILIMAFRVGWPLMLIPLVAIGNYLLFFAPDAWAMLHKQPARQRQRSAQFRQQVRPKSNKQARHTCAVCGITDIDDPGMEFRYCSLCKDYLCYCSKHLFGHEHK
ncbi:MAG: PLATZ transcription factor family protein [Oscillospiraceae bacterium]|nr:PLATZ transcription factor family protein [Oscillospiraceae bacterium]